MPPPSLRAGTAWRCSSCRQRPLFTTTSIHRPFSSTTPSYAIGPEHPHWIDVPKSLQPDKVRLARIRGHLPVPRDLFPRRRGGVERVTPAYLAETTKESQKPRATIPNADTLEGATEAERQAWKSRMADRRRQNLREGLLALQVRRQRADARAVKRAAELARTRKEAGEAPPSKEQALTAPTITQLMQPQRTRGFRIPDPNREQRVAAMKARVQATEQERKAARVGALQRLYMHARNFIVTEQQLDAAIDQQFGTPERPAMFGWKGTNIWHVRTPSAVQDKLNQTSTSRSKAEEDEERGFGSVGYRLAKSRMKRIAEELGGAKM